MFNPDKVDGARNSEMIIKYALKYRNSYCDRWVARFTYLEIMMEKLKEQRSKRSQWNV